MIEDQRNRRAFDLDAGHVAFGRAAVVDGYNVSIAGEVL
jgi:hypothetical protein